MIGDGIAVVGDCGSNLFSTSSSFASRRAMVPSVMNALSVLLAKDEGKDGDETVAVSVALLSMTVLALVLVLLVLALVVDVANGVVDRSTSGNNVASVVKDWAGCLNSVPLNNSSSASSLLPSLAISTLSPVALVAAAASASVPL